MTKSINDYNWAKHGNGRMNIGDGSNQEKMRDILNSTGDGFCLAKWTQVTMHLGNGLTHSCHHPTAHKIPHEELAKNPSALHNTEHKKERRKEMLNGMRPEECDFCWRVEDNGEMSDRVFKSIDEYSFAHHDKIAELDGDEDVFPTYVEVSFSRTCNFKCAYCGPAYSSQWHQEIKAEGPYELEKMKYNIIKESEDHILNSDHNPYVEAFWKWWPEAYKHMHTFRITGGEPLLVKDTWKVIDFLLENPNPNLHFAINSNGCPPDGLWLKFVDKIRQLQENKCIKSFILFTSAESTGERNDYVRYGMDYDLWKKNIEYFLRNTEGTGVTIMSAFNVFSVTTWKEMLEWVLQLKQDYNYSGWDKWILDSGLPREPKRNALPMNHRTNEKHDKRNRVIIDTPYLRHPSFLDANIITMDMVEQYLIPSMDFVFDNVGTGDWKANKGFDDWEAVKMRRNLVGIVQKAKAHEGDNLTILNSIRINRARFYDFVNEYDRRRNTNFVEIFPEYKDFYELCEQEHKIYYDKIEAKKNAKTGNN